MNGPQDAVVVRQLGILKNIKRDQPRQGTEAQGQSMGENPPKIRWTAFLYDGFGHDDDLGAGFAIRECGRGLSG